jgi:starch synthase
VRVVGAVPGDSYDPHNNSGTVRALFAALERRGVLVARVDVSMSEAQSAWAALSTFSPRMTSWKRRYRRSAYEVQSRNCEACVRKLDSAFDLILEPFRAFQPRGAPYALLLDTTDSLRAASDLHRPFSEEELGLEAERRLYHGAAHIFTMPSAPADSLLRDYGVPADRVTVVGGGVNIDALPAARRDRGTPLILFVGRDFRRKGGDMLIRAFREVRREVSSARLLVVGTDEAQAEPGVEILGEIRDRDQLARLYAEATVFCLPSRFEPTGMSLFEAMAHAIPCVGTTVGGIPEVVKHGETGLLVPPDDIDALSHALVRLLNDPHTARRLGENGRRLVEEEFNWDRVVERMLAALDRTRPWDTRPAADSDLRSRGAC